jgi:hypothetical protein
MKIIVTESQMKMVIENSQKPTRVSDVLINMWDKQTKEDGYPTFDEDVLRYFGIDEWTDINDYAEFFNDYIGGEEKTMKIIDKLLINNFSTKDFPERLVGGYDFDWRIIDVYVRDGFYNVQCEVAEGGYVTLMDGRHMTLEDALSDDEVGYEIEFEVSDVIRDCLNSLIRPRTGIMVNVYYVEI